MLVITTTLFVLSLFMAAAFGGLVGVVIMCFVQISSLKKMDMQFPQDKIK